MTTVTQIITKPDIADIAQQARDLHGCRMFTVLTETEPTLRRQKTNPLNGRVRKIQKTNGCLAFNYENAVNRQRVKDGQDADFTALKKKNMVHLGGGLIQHEKTGQLYIYFRPLSAKKAIYYVDGELTDFDDLEDDLYFPPKKENGGRQNVTKEVPYRTVKLENIRSITKIN